LIEETGSWHEEIHKAQDSDFFVRLILKCNRVLFSYETLVFYRILTNSVSTTLNVKSLESVLMVNSIIEKLVLEKQRNNDELVFSKDGKIIYVKARDLVN